ncbi:MAG TPA: response regulator [Kouleothrix sp.]|jgi:DNA-binding NarL/FixJ family response regulator|nr:response regulator [Kouleothrix sp.]
MAYRLLIVPGENEELRALPSQLADDVEARILDSANDALWEVRNSPPEAIIADVDLPGMSGLDLAEILPNFGVPTRVLLWSRLPNSRAAEQAAGHGVHTFLNGPLAPNELHNALYQALRHTPEPAPAAEAPAVAPEPVAPPPPAAPTARSEPAASASSLSSRARREARSAAPPPPPPARSEAPARKPSTGPRPRSGSLVLTADNLKPIRSRMEALSQDVGSQCILLANRAGMVLSEVGITSGLPTMILLPLLSTSFSTAGQISQILREDESTALYMHEGQRYDVYCFDILQNYMLVIVFDKGGLTTAKIGSVWVYAKRAIRDMQELLA